MRFFYYVLIIILALKLNIGVLFAKSGTENIDYYSKVELEYQKGNYIEALDISEKYLKEIENLVGKKHFIYARLAFQNAKINDALGDLSNYKKKLSEARKSLQLSDKKDVKSHAEALLSGADCFIDFGDYANAHNLLLDSKLLSEAKYSATEEHYIDKVKLKYAEVLLSEGFINKALPLVNKSLDYRNKRDVRKDIVKNEKTGVESKVVLSSEERLNRKRDIADAINLLIRIYIANGKLAQADSLVEATTEWVDAVLSKKDITYIKYMMLDGQLLELAEDTELAADVYDKAMKSYKKIKTLKSNKPNKTILDIFEKQVAATRFDNPDRASSLTKKMKNQIISAYGEENQYISKIYLTEVIELMLEQNYASADTMLRKLLQNKKIYPIDNLIKAKALDLLLDIQVELNKFKEAENTLQQIVSIKRKYYSPNAPALHLNYLDLANFKVVYSNQFKEVDTLFTNGLKVIEEEVPPSYPSYFTYHYKYAKYLYYSDRLQEAEKYLSIVADNVRLEFGKNSKEFCEALCQLSNAQTDNGNYAGAIGNLELASEALNNAPQKSEADRVGLIEQYVHYYTTIGDFEEVQAQAKKAGRIINKKDKFQLEYSGAIEKNIELKINQGYYQEAEEEVTALLENYTNALGKDNKKLASCLDLASRIEEVFGHFSKGEEYAQKSAEITRLNFGDSSLVHMQSLNHLVQIYIATHEYELAEKIANQIVNIYRKKLEKKHILLAQGLNTLAHIKVIRNKTSPVTENYFKEALQIIESTLSKAHPKYAEVLTNYAQLKIDFKDFQSAEKLLNEAHQVYLNKFGEGNIHSIHSFFVLGNLHSYRRNFDAAKKEFLKARTLTNKVFGKEHPMYVNALSKEIQMEYALGNIKQAAKDFEEVANINLAFISNYFEGLTERDKNIQNARIKSDFEFFYNIVAKLGKEDPSLVAKAYNYVLASKSMLLNSNIKTKTRIYESKDTVLIKKYQDWVRKKETISSSLLISISQRQKDSINIEQLQKEIHQLEKEIVTKSQTFEHHLAKNIQINWHQVKDSLKANDVALEMLRCRHFTYKFSDSIFYLSLVISPQNKNAPEMIVLPNGNQMEKKYFSYYKNCVRFDLQDVYSKKIFWEPLKNVIGEGKKIYFSPDGVYHLINLEGIPSGKIGQNVIDEETIVLVANTKDIAHKAKKIKASKNDKNKIELIGNPQFYISEIKNSKQRRVVSSLPGSETEVKEIGTILNKKGIQTDVLLSANASEQNIKSMVDPQIFHIATHGFFLANPSSIDANRLFLNDQQEKHSPLLRAGLLLTNGGKLFDTKNIYKFNSEDGILTANEAMNLHLDHTDLVVLSACETAAGEVSTGEGVYGLQRSFMVAGAKSVIISLFKVSDSITEELMASFYKKWIESGDKRAAFIAAKKEIREKYNQANYWANFIMMGL
ncbi:MAG: CHAT domain-containing protein [Cytophagales bacterium]|nr:MAG: CHAT domain-containing protein [Cytophagales bacterium]